MERVPQPLRSPWSLPINIPFTKWDDPPSIVQFYAFAPQTLTPTTRSPSDLNLIRLVKWTYKWAGDWRQCKPCVENWNLSRIEKISLSLITFTHLMRPRPPIFHQHFTSKEHPPCRCRMEYPNIFSPDFTHDTAFHLEKLVLWESIHQASISKNSFRMFPSQSSLVESKIFSMPFHNPWVGKSLVRSGGKTVKMRLFVWDWENPQWSKISISGFWWWAQLLNFGYPKKVH